MLDYAKEASDDRKMSVYFCLSVAETRGDKCTRERRTNQRHMKNYVLRTKKTHKGLKIRLEEPEIGGRAETIQNYTIFKIDQITQKSPGD